MNTTPKPVQLYTVKGHTGAHLLEKLQEIHPYTDDRMNDAETVARVLLVGAVDPFFVPVEDLAPFTLDNKYQGGDITIILAQEAATVYNQDPRRVQRAADLNRNTYAVQVAHKDENGQKITRPNWKTAIVKGSKGGWYVITRGNCTCEDHKKGNTCKHRIAVWMRRESIARPAAAARRVDVAVIMAELES